MGLPGTLRGRLVLTNLGLFATAQALLFVLAYHVIADVLRDRMDQKLVQHGERVIQSLTEIRPAGPGSPPPGVIESGEFYCQVMTPDGDLLHCSDNVEGADGMPSLAEPVSDPRWSTVRVKFAEAGLPDGRVLRVVTSQHEVPGRGPMVVQVGVDPSEVEGALGSLRMTLWVLGPLTLLILGMATWWAARRSLSPIGRIADEARERDIGDLHEPLSVPSGRSEVAEMTRTINGLLAKLQEASRSQQRFTAHAAHELKSPIARLMGQAQVLQQRSRGVPEYEQFAAEVEGEMRHLGQVVESLLVLARTDGADGPTRDAVAIHDLVLDVLEKCHAESEAAQVKLTPRLAENVDDLELPGDAGLLQVMLENLLRNAIRHAPPGSAVDVQVVPDDEIVVLRVRDRGPGIPDEVHPHLFDRFFTTTGTSSGGGSGLGLAIARNVARFHGGDLTAANAADGGAEFRVELPRQT